MDTIFALSSGQPPSAIAVIRISGSQTASALSALARALPQPRRASLRRLYDPQSGEELDQALVLWFPGPASATGEDLAELHLHGGRAVVAAIETALGNVKGLRPATAGEFTQRALMNGRIDLTQAEGLGELLSAETEAARRAAVHASEGGIRKKVEQWNDRLLNVSASVEAELDHSDEEDVAAVIGSGLSYRRDCIALAEELERALASPSVERLNEGIRIVLAGPPNSGKSSLINAMTGRDVAIVSAIAGTTRDRIEMAVTRRGYSYILTDTAGLATKTDDPIEAIGIERARQALDAADAILWLGDENPDIASDASIILIHARCDEPERDATPDDRTPVSSKTGAGLSVLWEKIEELASRHIPAESAVFFNERQRRLITEWKNRLEAAAQEEDLLLVGEQLRLARSLCDQITGRAGVEAMLGDIFARFCIGK
ncbi:tRNA uridine-5-carboxymethylaminomethyl(34) synthesis GTPase MnmE [Stakelama sediminis]|uniref:tRNA uridine-5-carboxymethylaminomethyl(34) synthesis GTPase MnmE n=1 Tax=Stakelama sediminis TaxID=463200 RepID=UPI0016151A3C